MKKLIQINHERVYLHAIASFVYDQEVLEDGEVLDRTPIPQATRLENLKISLMNGREIVVEGNQASEVAEILEENSKNIGSFLMV